MDPESLLAVAREAMDRAYAPYSGFRVGAALLTRGGDVHVGCNVENASFGLTLCAERAAVVRAVSEGDVEFEAVAIVTEGDTPAVPCGACLQVLAEFGTQVTVISKNANAQRAWTLNELLPAPFEGSAVLTSRREAENK